MKFFALSVLFLYVLVSTPLSELTKLPELYLHYIEHKEDNKELSLMRFLRLHYGGDSEHARNHHNLPFKTTKENTVFSVQIPPNEFICKLVHIGEMILSSDNFIYKAIYVSQFLDAIWQPPRA